MELESRVLEDCGVVGPRGGGDLDGLVAAAHIKTTQERRRGCVEAPLFPRQISPENDGMLHRQHRQRVMQPPQADL